MYPTILQSHDQELEDRILACIHSCQDACAEDVQLQVDGGVAKIGGSVPTLRDHDLFLQFCQHVPGVVRVVDELQIGRTKSADRQRWQQLATTP